MGNTTPTPLRVAEVELSLQQGEVVAHVEHDGESLGCPECSEPARRYDTPQRRWRHPDACQYRTSRSGRPHGARRRGPVGPLVGRLAAAAAALVLGSCGAIVNAPEEPVRAAEQPQEIDEQHDGVVRVRGTLEDSETDTGRSGEVRAYRSNADGTYTLLDADTTDGAGNFALSFQDDAAVFDLQARLKDGAADASYVRTLTLPMQSASELLVRAVPYTGLNGGTPETDITVERFREFIIEIMEDEYVGLIKWKPGHLKGMEVLHEYVPLPTDLGDEFLQFLHLPGSFTRDELDVIEEALRSADGRAMLGGGDIPFQIDGPSTPDADKHYYYPEGGGLIVDDGWIVMFPRGNRDPELGLAAAQPIQGSVYVGSATITLTMGNREYLAQLERYQPGYFRFIVVHELAHVIYAFKGHTRVLDRNQSVVSVGRLDRDESRCLSLCFADRKALAIAQEDTFPAGVRAGDVVLGLSWHD